MPENRFLRDLSTTERVIADKGVEGDSYGAFRGSGAPATGTHVELTHDGTKGHLRSYDRTAGAAKAMAYHGTSHEFDSPVAVAGGITADLAVVGKAYGAFSGTGAPTSGTSVELTHDGTTGRLRSYDRTAGAVKAMAYHGLSHTFDNPVVVAGTVTVASGVIFPATQVPSSNPNCFDDYEEGDWTPTLGGEGTNTGQTYIVRKGSYTKKGREVTITFEILLSAKGTLGGTLAAVTGIPFTAVSGKANGGASIGYCTGLGSSAQDLSGYIQNNSTNLFLCGSTSLGANPRDNLALSVVGNSTYLMGSATFFV